MIPAEIVTRRVSMCTDAGSETLHFLNQVVSGKRGEIVVELRHAASIPWPCCRGNEFVGWSFSMILRPTVSLIND